TQSFWQATISGRSGITAFSQQDSLPLPIQVAGSIRNFLAEDYLEKKLINRTDRMTHFALAAIQEALYDANLSPEQLPPERMGAVIANSLGGINFVIKQLQTLYTRGPRYVSAYTAIAWLNTANVGQAAIRHGLQGYCKTPVNDAAGGLDALGIGYRAIRRGAADLLLAGGSEAFLHPLVLLVLRQQGQCYTGNDPCGYRPFDQRAAGLVVAEGAGICVLEEYEHACAREATIYGEIVGYGQSNDAHGMLPPAASGKHYARAIQQAMTEGSLQMEELAYLHLDGHALTMADEGEVAALHEVFGEHLANIPASVPRTMLGHSNAAAGAIDALTALLALKHGCIPPTIHCEQPDPRYPLRLVHQQAQSFENDYARAVLVGGRGVGGSNVALALRKV
ncbi:MAG TPA: beta-ketoacyl-[acyl-carrier-protein] synthase family protein, partial [Ktedonobacteraceae bacterium]